MCDLPRKFRIALVAVAAAGAMTAGAGSLFAQNTNAPAGGNGNAAALTQMSHEATRIFDDANNAVTALNNNNKTAAERDITMAMSVRNRLAMTAQTHHFAKVVPVYSEIEQSTAFGSIMAKKNNGQAPAPAKVPVAVDDVKDQFTFVGIDLDKTKARLQSANEAIKNNNVQAAKDTLNAIGEDLVVVKVDADAPLLAIRENLGLAHIAAAKMQKKEAAAALQQASVELTAYAQQNGPHQQDAKMLQGKISHMLSGGGEMSASSATTIGNWWSQVNGWMQMPPA